MNECDYRITSNEIIGNDVVEGKVTVGVNIKSGVDGDKDGYNDLYKSLAIIPNQTHSLNVGIVDESQKEFPDTDALITFRKDISIGVLTADCVPIVIWSPDVKGVAAIHAGWRGTLGGIVDRTVEVLKKYNADPSEMQVAFGPSISCFRYEVDQELADKFIEAGFKDCVEFPEGSAGKPHLDLQKVNIERLLLCGLRKENIRPFKGCSYDSKNKIGDHLYYSHRRSGGGEGRNLTSIKILDK